LPELFHDTTTAAVFSAAKLNKINLYESHRLFCDVYCLEPGQSQSEHSHTENDKIYHVLTGRCEVSVGDDRRDLNAGELAVAPAGVVHGARNVSSERTTMLVIMAPHPGMKG